MKVEFALVGIVISAFIGWLIGVILEHPPGPGGLQFFGALIGAWVAVAVLILGEALKPKK